MQSNLIKNELTESSMWGLGVSGGYIIAIPIFGYHYAMGREFSYQDSLAAISMLGAASMLIFQQIFMALSILSNFFAILKRVGEILEMDEFHSDDLKIMDEEQQDKDYEYDTSYFELQPGKPQFVAVAGVVGSGKSTLLSCIMSKILKNNKQVSMPQFTFRLNQIQRLRTLNRNLSLYRALSKIIFYSASSSTKPR